MCPCIDSIIINAHSSVIHNSPKVEPTQKTVVRSCSGPLLSSKEVCAGYPRANPPHSRKLGAFMSLCFDEMSRASKSTETEYRLWFPRTEGELAKEMEFPYQNMIKVFWIQWWLLYSLKHWIPYCKEGDFDIWKLALNKKEAISLMFISMR